MGGGAAQSIRIALQPAALLVLYVLPGVLAHPWILPYLLLAIPAGITVYAIWEVAQRRRDPGILLVELCVEAATLILYCALVYRDVGLHVDPGDGTAATPLYFSIVTWTTLGYGDVRPMPAYQMFAGLEALLGYVYLGLIVGLLGRFLEKR